MRNAGLDEAQAGIKIAGRNINNFRWHHPYGRKWRGTEEPLDESERGEWKSCLKTQHSRNENHSIWSLHFLANSWVKNGNRDFIFLHSKITADGDCSHGIKRHLLLGWKTMTNLDSILKSRDIICLQRSEYSKLWFFSSHVWMWESDHKESWAPKNWCFWTVVLEKTLENPLDSKEIKPVNPEGNQP